MIDGASGGLGSFVSDECRGFFGFVVGFGRALAWSACGDQVGIVEGVELTLGLDVERSGKSGFEEVLLESEGWRGEFLGGTVRAVDSFDTNGRGVLLSGGVDRDLFAFSEGSGAARAVGGVVVGEFRAGEQLGGVGADCGQHWSATSHSSAWKASRWRSCSRMDSRLQAVQRQ